MPVKITVNDESNFYNGKEVIMVEDHAEVGVVTVKLAEKQNISFAIKRKNLIFDGTEY